jgi:hypothetical protein
MRCMTTTSIWVNLTLRSLCFLRGVWVTKDTWIRILCLHRFLQSRSHSKLNLLSETIITKLLILTNSHSRNLLHWMMNWWARYLNKINLLLRNSRHRSTDQSLIQVHSEAEMLSLRKDHQRRNSILCKDKGETSTEPSEGRKERRRTKLWLKKVRFTKFVLGLTKISILIHLAEGLRWSRDGFSSLITSSGTTKVECKHSSSLRNLWYQSH